MGKRKFLYNHNTTHVRFESILLRFLKHSGYFGTKNNVETSSKKKQSLIGIGFLGHLTIDIISFIL